LSLNQTILKGKKIDVKISSPPKKDHKDSENKTVFVSNLSPTATENDIKKFFSKCGTLVSVRMIKHRTGNSKGIAYVDFSTEEDVSKAIEMNEKVLLGRQVGVEKSDPSKSKSKTKEKTPFKIEIQQKQQPQEENSNASPFNAPSIARPGLGFVPRSLRNPTTNKPKKMKVKKRLKIIKKKQMKTKWILKKKNQILIQMMNLEKNFGLK